jgi:hypothetical protein
MAGILARWWWRRFVAHYAAERKRGQGLNMARRWRRLMGVPLLDGFKFSAAAKS